MIELQKNKKLVKVCSQAEVSQQEVQGPSISESVSG